MTEGDRTGARGFDLTAEQIRKIEADYAAVEARNRALLDEVGFILDDVLRSENLKIHSIDPRLKKLPSVVAKCRRDSIVDIASLTDIVGTRVICLFRSDLDQVGRLIGKHLKVLEVDDKLAIANNPLGYLSVHYLCQIPDHFSGHRYENIKGITFEIQVRTLCMHCWAAVSHHLDYKGDWDVPAELKRALSALSGLFYVADNEFEQFYSARMESRRKAEESPQKNQEINLDTLSAYLRAKFPDRVQMESSHREVSRFVRELKDAGYSSISEVDRDVDRAAAAFAKFEQKHRRQHEPKFFAIGAVRISLRMSSEQFRKNSGASDNDPVYEFLRLVRPAS